MRLNYKHRIQLIKQKKYTIILFFLVFFSLFTLAYAQYTIIGEWGKCTNVTDNWYQVNFSRSFTNYALILGPPSMNETTAYVFRVSNVTTTGFSIRAVEPDCENGTRSLNEMASWLVCMTGTWLLSDGSQIESHYYTTTASGGHYVTQNQDNNSFSLTYSDAPAVVAGIMSYNYTNYLYPHINSLTSTGFSIWLEEDESKTNAFGTNEQLGWIAMTAGLGTLRSNVAYEAGDISSMSDQWKTHSFIQSYSEQPAYFALQKTYIGPDNSHTAISNITSSNILIKLQEDSCSDTETTHTTELSTYCAFEGSRYLYAVTNTSLVIGCGSGSPSGAIPRTAVNKEIFQFSVQNSFSVNITNVWITLHAHGTGDDSSTTITNFKIWKDVDENGFLSSGDTLADGTNTWSGDNGTNRIFLDSITSNETILYLVVCDIINAVNGDTFYISFDNTDITGTAQSTSAEAVQGIHGPATGFVITVEVSASAGVAEVGVIHNVTETWSTLSFLQTYSAPVVIAIPPSFNETNVVVVRCSNITATNCRIRVQEPYYDDHIHAGETVHYFVADEGSYALQNGHQLIVGKTNTTACNGTFITVPFEQSFSANPVCIATVQTHNDTNFVHTRERTITQTNFQVSMEEEDVPPDTTHGEEIIGFFAMDCTVDHNNNNLYETDKTSDTFTGEIWKTHLFTASFASRPVLISHWHTDNGVDSAFCRYRYLTKNSFQIRVQEDESDADITHIANGFVYAAFESPGILVGVTNEISLSVHSSYTQYAPTIDYSGHTNVKIMSVFVTNTNSTTVERVPYFREICLHVHDTEGNIMAPADAIDRWEARFSSGTFISSSSNIPTGSIPLTINLNPGMIYVSNNKSVRVEVYVDWASNFGIAASNVVFEITTKTNISVVDPITHVIISNYLVSGYSLPFTTTPTELLAYFTIDHTEIARTNTWSNVFVRACYINGSTFTNMNPTWRVVLTTDGTASTIDWTNNNGAGVFSNGGAGIGAGSAVYYFNTADNGTNTFQIKNTTVETCFLNITMDTVHTETNDGILEFYGDVDVVITKAMQVSNSGTYTGLGGSMHDFIPGSQITYVITISNNGPGKATNISLSDTLPIKLAYIAGSITIDGVSMTDAADGDAADFTAGVLSVHFAILSETEKRIIIVKTTLR